MASRETRGNSGEGRQASKAPIKYGKTWHTDNVREVLKEVDELKQEIEALPSISTSSLSAFQECLSQQLLGFSTQNSQNTAAWKDMQKALSHIREDILPMFPKLFSKGVKEGRITEDDVNRLYFEYNILNGVLSQQEQKVYNALSGTSGSIGSRTARIYGKSAAWKARRDAQVAEFMSEVS